MEITSQELMKMMENNELLAKDFLPKFAVAMRESVREGDALNKMMQGTQSQMGRFGNSINDAAMAFSRGGFNKAFLEFLAQATASLNELVSAGFFDALGFGFRMLVAPIRAAMEVVEGLAGIFKKASEEGGEYKDTLIAISVVLGVLLLPTLLSIGRALAPFLLMTAGLIALGDIMKGLAGDSSEFGDNWAKLTESFKNGKTDWEAFTKVATELGIALGGILATTIALRKLNPFKGKGSVVPSTTTSTATKATGGVAGTLIRRVLGVVGLGIGADGVGAGSDQIYDSNGNLKSQFKAYDPNAEAPPSLPMFGANNRIDNLNRVDGEMPSLPMFDSNNKMVRETRRLPSSYASQSSSSSSPSVTIANMNINGESAPENLRTNMESYMDNLLGEVFTDAMRETVR